MEFGSIEEGKCVSKGQQILPINYNNLLVNVLVEIFYIDQDIMVDKVLFCSAQCVFSSGHLKVITTFVDTR
jgi:hypothetical protein